MKFINLDNVVTAEVDDGYIKVLFVDGSYGRYKMCYYPMSDNPEVILNNSNIKFLKVEDIKDAQF